MERGGGRGGGGGGGVQATASSGQDQVVVLVEAEVALGGVSCHWRNNPFPVPCTLPQSSVAVFQIGRHVTLCACFVCFMMTNKWQYVQISLMHHVAILHAKELARWSLLCQVVHQAISRSKIVSKGRVS